MTPAMICAFALGRGRYCGLPYLHVGPHDHPVSDESGADS